MTRTILMAVAAASCLAVSPLAAQDAGGETLAETGTLVLDNGAAFAAGAAARSGAGYLTIRNTGDGDDRLVAAESPAAERVEVHTHALEDGVARMVALEDGIEVPAGETVTLARGGLHLMFLGLTEAWQDGNGVAVTLVFEEGGPVEIVLPRRAPAGEAEEGHEHGGGPGHGQQEVEGDGHGATGHGH